jgi:hypothetical protein
MKRGLVAIGLICICVAGLAMAFHRTGGTARSAPPEPQQIPGPAVLGSEDAYLPVLVKHEADASCGAIQTAIDSLPAAGGQVVVSSGIFVCDTAIVIDRNNVALRGQGSSTVLFLAAGSNSPVLVIGSTATPPQTTYFNIHVSDLAIDGNRANQTIECWGGPCDSGGLTTIRNNGVTVRGATDVVIERVTVARARSGGLVTEKGCRRITVSEFTATDNQFDGLAAYQTEDSIFSNLYLYNNPFAGMSLDIDFNNNIVTGAIMAGNGKQGIFMRDSRDNVFGDIQIHDSGEQGLFLAQVDADANTAATGNTFHGLTVTGSIQAGMRVNNASCVNNLVVGAQFADNAACISEDSPGLVEQVGVICR